MGEAGGERDRAEVQVARGGDGETACGEVARLRLVPRGELVEPGRDVGEFELAGGVAGVGEGQASTGLAEADPGASQRRAGGTHDLAAHGDAAAQDGAVVNRLGEADGGVITRRAELKIEGGFARTDPGLGPRAAGAGGGLAPPLAPGRGDAHGVLAVGEVFDQRLAVGGGQDEPLALLEDGAEGVVGRAERVAGGVARHLAGVVEEPHGEAAQTRLDGGIGPAVQGGVILVNENRELARRQGQGVDGDGRGGLGAGKRKAAEGVAGIGKDGQEVALGGVEGDAGDPRAAADTPAGRQRHGAGMETGGGGGGGAGGDDPGGCGLLRAASGSF